MLQLRKDVYVYNEATGFVITSQSLNGFKKKEFKGKKWLERIQDGTMLPVSIVQDDSMCFRVIVNGDLTEAEDAEWTDRLVYKLHVPDGKLVLSAGSAVLEEDDDMEEYYRVVEIPPGSYQIELFTNFAGVNGDWPLGKAGISYEEIPDYFKRTRPGEKMPEWMVDWLDVDDDDSDGEGESEKEEQERPPSPLELSWDAWGEPEEEEPEETEEREPSSIDFTIRLTPLISEPPLPKLDGNWAEIDQNPRIPEKCPTGLLSNNVAGLHDREPHVQTDLIYRAKVAQIVKKLKLTAIKGGPVSIPVSDLVLPYWFAWMCRDGVFVQMRIKLNGAKVDIDWPGLKDGFDAQQKGDEIVVDFDGNNAKWTNIRRLHRAGHLIEGLPDGVTISLDMCEDIGEEEEDEDDALAGCHRYRGEVKAGLWQISESYPKVEAKTLQDILSLAREVDLGGAITMRSQEEVDNVLATVKKEDFLLRDTMPVAEGLSLKAKGLMLTGMLGAWVLRERYEDEFPLISLGDDLDQWDNAMKNLEQAFAAVHTEDALVYEGVSGPFHSTNMSAHHAVKPEDVIEHDFEMEQVGMIVLGDIVSSRFTDVAIRCYAHSELPIYGAMNRNAWGFGSSDFFTRFPDGWSLTTSTMEASDQPKKKIYRQGGSEELDELFQVHQSRLDELIAKHGTPESFKRSLVGIAEEIDIYLAKELELVKP
jgi:hypothetical protein